MTKDAICCMLQLDGIQCNLRCVCIGWPVIAQSNRIISCDKFDDNYLPRPHDNSELNKLDPRATFELAHSLTSSDLWTVSHSTAALQAPHSSPEHFVRSTHQHKPIGRNKIIVLCGRSQTHNSSLHRWRNYLSRHHNHTIPRPSPD